MKRIAVVVLCLLFVPSGLAWTQLAGDAGHTGTAFLPDGPMDVLSVIDLADHDLKMAVGYGPTFVTTPQGSAFYATHTDGSCRLGFLTLDGPTSRELADCAGGSPTALVAYDDVLGLGLLCHGGVSGMDDVLLSAVDLEDGETVWQVTPGDLGAGATADQVSSGTTWECNGPALDAELGTVYLPAVATGGTTTGADRGTDHRVAAILTATGEVQWSTYLDPQLFAEQTSGQDTGLLGELLPGESVDPGAPFQRTEVETVTRTATGLTVLGEINDERMFLNLDLQGNVVGFVRAVESDDGPIGEGTLPVDVPEALQAGVPVTSGNAWAVANGPLAVAGLGNDLVLIDPLVDVPQARAPLGSAQDLIAHDFIGPARLQDLALVPARNNLVAVDMANLQSVWQHPAGPYADAFSLLGVLTAADGRIYTFEDHPNHGEKVVLLDHQSGRALMAWPVPLNVTGVEEVRTTRMSAVPGSGLLVVQEPGRIVRLGVNASAPSLGLEADMKAPPSGTPMTLTIDEEALRDTVATTVYWGDGSFTPYDPDQETMHIYFGSGERTIAVVAERADGTTVTDTTTVDVDGTELSWLEEQFQPGNLDMTWGVIGIAIAVLGGGTTYIVATLKRRKMKREMDRLDAIHDLAVEEPVLAMGELRGYRKDLRERAKKGRIDDPPLASLLQEVQKLFRVIEQRMAAAFEDRMSPSMRTAMTAAFADGVLSKGEIADLQTRLRKESRLSEGERDDLRDLLANWV